MSMRVEYEREYDLLFAWEGEPQVCESIEIEPGLIVRVSRQTGKAVGVEVIGAAARFRVDPHTDWWALVEGILTRYGATAERIFAEDGRP